MAVLVDTGVFFAFYSLRDKHHLDALGLVVHMVEGRWGRAFITNHILDETLTLLKYRLSAETAEAFLEAFIDRGTVRVLHIDEELEALALRIFRENLSKKGLSYTDATTVAALRKYRIGYLLSFDLRSFSGLAESIIGPGYWASLPEDERRRLLALERGALAR